MPPPAQEYTDPATDTDDADRSSSERVAALQASLEDHSSRLAAARFAAEEAEKALAAAAEQQAAAKRRLEERALQHADTERRMAELNDEINKMIAASELLKQENLDLRDQISSCAPLQRENAALRAHAAVLEKKAEHAKSNRRF